MSAIKFDKRLYGRYLKSGDATRDDLNAYHADLPDLSGELRYREEQVEDDSADAAEAEGGEGAGEGSATSTESSDG